VGNLIAITGHMKSALSLADHKINKFYPKTLPLSNYEEDLLPLELLSKYLLTTELRFDAMCSNLGNESSDAGHMKCSRGPQVPHPWHQGRF